ncbi:MAG: ATP-binding cassette domain-containing protein, partial [Bacteroidales bacterium]|nr:ATP-binding cassette domain-containing protein [Bacteroidales bacterium]
SEMAFMDAIETTCEACGGLRYREEALHYTLTSPATGQTLDIAQAMDLSVRLASAFFAGTVIEQKLRPLVDVGLQYLHLNQSLSTLSGGELQRLKLASCLGVEDKVFIVDEPTDGLHVKDIRHIIRLFDSLVGRGNTVYMIEHNLDVIRSADFLLELGPGAGEEGGSLLYAGTPAGLAACPASVTAAFL